MRGRIVIIMAAGFAALAAAVWLVSLASGRDAAPETTTAESPAPVAAPAPVEARPTAPSRPAPPPAAVPAAQPPEAPPTTGTLRIDSDVPGASVFIDRVYLGTTPVTASDLTPGTHRLNVSAEGYEGVLEEIEVAPGPRDLLIKFKEIRLDVAIDVTHKHTFGSCTGRLSATPKGLRYETTNENDAFTVALTDLEIFEVDYLAKNLKVKIRSGKTYNFTNLEDDPEPLFDFHRDVEKVRQRLLGGG